MDTLELDPRLRHATAFLAKEPLMLIDGELVPAVSGKTFAVYNPSTGAVIANVPEADKRDVDVVPVILVAHPPIQRNISTASGKSATRATAQGLPLSLADLIERDLEELAELESIDADRLLHLQERYSPGRDSGMDIAVAAARRASDEQRWARVSPSTRGRMLWKPNRAGADAAGELVGGAAVAGPHARRETVDRVVGLLGYPVEIVVLERLGADLHRDQAITAAL